MYNFYYLSWALFSTLISVYLMGKGYRASQVSLVVSASFLASIVFQNIAGHILDAAGYSYLFCICFICMLGGLLLLGFKHINKVKHIPGKDCAFAPKYLPFHFLRQVAGEEITAG